ncbi:MAG: Lin0512 family protein [Pseudoruegeria sp.]
MAETQILVEFGMGSSLRRADYTGAAERAIRDALWHNSISAAELFGFEKTDMIIDVDLGVARPDMVNTEALRGIFPYGTARFHVTHGGLDVPKPDGSGVTVIANAALRVSFDMEKAHG